VALHSEVVAVRVEQFGGERTGTHAGGVGLDDTQDVVQVPRADAAAAGGTAGGGVGGGDIRVGAVVDVPQRPLGTLEEDVLALPAHGVQQSGYAVPGVVHQADQLLALGQGLVQHLLVVHRVGLEVVLQGVVVVLHHLAQALLEVLRVHQLTQADAAARHLVLVGGTDAAAGGADGLLAAGHLTGVIQGHVVGEDQRAGFADGEPLTGRHPGLVQHLQLLQQRRRGEHHAVAYQAAHILAQDAGGDQVQHGLLAVDDQGVTGVVAPLEACHRVGLVGEQIHHLALSFIAPLGPDYDYVLAHRSSFTS